MRARSPLLGACLIINFVVDAPGGRWTLVAIIAVALASWAAANQIARRAGRGRGRGSFRLGLSWLAISSAVELGVVDALALREEYTTVHDLLLACGLVLFVLGFTLLVVTGPRVRVAIGALVAIALCGFGVSALGAGTNPWPAILRTHSAHERVIAAARRLFDRDGDGFSPLFGGGDCDDHDPNAFPLSTVGRDCLGWMRHRPAPRPEVYSKALPPANADHRGAGHHRRVPLRLRRGRPAGARAISAPGCPAGRSGLVSPSRARQLSGDRAIDDRAADRRSVLQSGASAGAPVLSGVASSLRAASATRAIVTHPYVLADSGVRASFGTVDQTLIPAATAPGGATAERVTDRVLDALAAARGPTYIWAHYFIRMRPDVREDGDVLTGSDANTYAAELHRTDDAIARLAAALARRPDAARTILFVTADHGSVRRARHRRTRDRSLRRGAAGADDCLDRRPRLPRARRRPSTLEHVEVAGYLTRLFTGDPPPRRATRSRACRPTAIRSLR